MVLMLMRLILFALALGLTFISFQAYNQKGGKRLESAFIGFAFISMGVALTNISMQITEGVIYFNIAETVPFIVGFSMLYLSLYR
ncbi:hypothetical protein [Haloarchaeobius sp. HME9146]|uniref:DUF7521 family protein n=1 Tax=Haloarchaeobius sp. HME9146 TaxID=2978732 RepID=UPI0021C24342|nr:hypothetical protein [Haloarchaeobius sp. HME9146]MCT9097080.1 hypothetical protein [Haloarchaeobius sp. HME9146]